MRLLLVLGAFVLMGMLGCGGHVATESVEVTPGPSPVKLILEDVAKTGTFGSGMMEVQTELEAMKTTDAAKADKLLKQLEDLQKTTDPNQIKTKAKNLAAQL